LIPSDVQSNQNDLGEYFTIKKFSGLQK